MLIKILILTILIPSAIEIVFSAIQKRTIVETTDVDAFTVELPNIVAIIGAIWALTSAGVIFCFTLFSEELPHVIFYVIFGMGVWSGTYLIVKTLAFKVIVDTNKITVFSPFKKSYSFTFNEIHSAKRQVKNNSKAKSERIVIKTFDGRKLIVESAEISYKKFAKRIQSEVKKEYLSGF